MVVAVDEQVVGFLCCHHCGWCRNVRQSGQLSGHSHKVVTLSLSSSPPPLACHHICMAVGAGHCCGVIVAITSIGSSGVVWWWWLWLMLMSMLLCSWWSHW